MRYRKFARGGWSISEIGYGMWGMAGWTGSEDRESFESLDRAIELGCNFFDTAWAYGDGHSEQLLGETAAACPKRQAYGHFFTTSGRTAEEQVRDVGARDEK